MIKSGWYILSVTVYRISDLIREYRLKDLSYDVMHLKDISETKNGNYMILATSSIVDKYKDILRSKTVLLDLSTREKRRYNFNPKLLSFDLYQTTELWSLILNANEMVSISQFDLNKISNLKVYDGSILRIIERIIDTSQSFINDNEQYITDMTIAIKN